MLAKLGSHLLLAVALLSIGLGAQAMKGRCSWGPPGARKDLGWARASGEGRERARKQKAWPGQVSDWVDGILCLGRRGGVC